MELTLDTQALPVIHALDSPTRLDILNQLAKQPLTITELAQRMHYSKAIISKHVKVLELAQLIHESPSPTGDRRQKLMVAGTQQILLNLPEKIYPDFNRTDFDVPIGNYFANSGIEPSCGMASKTRVLGEMDDPDVFLSPQRLDAGLLWFTKGAVEYMIPNAFSADRLPQMIDLSFELSSEYPGSNNNWPSDISFWLNDVLVGTYTVPANFSDVRGRLTPSWWPAGNSQYGALKHLRIRRDNTGLDAQELSKVTLADIGLQPGKPLRFRIGVAPDAPHQGGLTLFGKSFGNYPQEIHVTFYHSPSA